MSSRTFITALLLMTATVMGHAGNDKASGISRPREWRIGAEISPSWVPGTNNFLEGVNPENKTINHRISADLRADFSFEPSSREGRIYRDLYQGIGLGINSYSAAGLLGTPISVYVYQGAPISRFSPRLWLGYEWQFGIAAGWKHFEEYKSEDNVAVGTPVTAHMALLFKLHYSLSERWRMSFGAGANHYSNGNTAWPNAGVNSIGAAIGIAYTLNPGGRQQGKGTSGSMRNDNLTDPNAKALCQDAGQEGSHAYGSNGRWFYDITAYGAWRKRVVSVGEPAEPQLCPGRFGILGLQVSPMYRTSNWIAIGAAVDMQWDESTGLNRYWIDGTSGDHIKFERPPFGEQLSAGISAHAELTMPIFSVNAGLGYELIAPDGEKRFYQSLTLKTFITKRIYLNTGYRLGDFKDPQNLTLGLGVRL